MQIISDDTRGISDRKGKVVRSGEDRSKSGEERVERRLGEEGESMKKALFERVMLEVRAQGSEPCYFKRNRRKQTNFVDLLSFFALELTCIDSRTISATFI